MLSPESFSQQLENRKLNIYNVVALQHGKTKWSFYRKKEERFLQHSISKSLVSLAAGFAVSERKITLDDKLHRYFPLDAVGLPSMNITLRQLLTMSSGHEEDVLSYEKRSRISENDWVRYYLGFPLRYKPGTRFCYSSGDTYMASAMLQQATGETVKDYLTQRLFYPLDIQDIRWDTCPLGRTLGCSGLYLTTDELSSVGQFLLQKGSWKYQQLLSDRWIAQATGKRIATTGSPDWARGYGYYFWQCTHNAYRADGMRGQFCIVIPNRDAVIAINSDEDKAQEILELIWETIYPLLD